MEFRQLRTFRVVAGLSSFSQAAQTLHYSQSTVSDQIRLLESDLNTKLFHRTGRTVKLTESGEKLLQYAQRLMDIEEELKSELTAGQEHQGALSVRIPETVSSYFLPDVLGHFHSRFPQIRCSFNNCTSTSLQPEFQSGMTNLAFLIYDEPFGAPNLVVEDLMPVRLELVAHPQHPLALSASVHIDDLKDQTVSLPQWDCSYGNLLKRGLVEHKINSCRLFEFNCLEAIKKCVMTGLGIALVSEVSVREEKRMGLLTALNWKGAPLTARLLMISLKDKWASAPLVAFMDMVRARVDLIV